MTHPLDELLLGVDGKSRETRAASALYVSGQFFTLNAPLTAAMPYGPLNLQRLVHTKPHGDLATDTSDVEYGIYYSQEGHSPAKAGLWEGHESIHGGPEQILHIIEKTVCSD